MKHICLCLVLLSGWSASLWASAVVELAQRHTGAVHDSEILLPPNTDLAFPDIHGIGYTTDGQRLVVAAHDGLRQYSAGAWVAVDGPSHDYMGFAVVSGGYFASGHPSPRTRLRNPLGLVWVSEDGRSVTGLAFAGRQDFHLLTASYYTHAVYATSEEADPTLPGLIHSSTDRGTTWKHGRGRGLNEPPVAMAAHPSAPGVLVVGTRAGLYLSYDYGDTFQQLVEDCLASAVAYSPDGQALVYACGDRLTRRSVRSLSESAMEPLPLAAGETVTALAVNPVRPNEVAVATPRKNIYFWQGQRWRRIVAEGWEAP